jgi:hypothetical protein
MPQNKTQNQNRWVLLGAYRGFLGAGDIHMNSIRDMSDEVGPKLLNSLFEVFKEGSDILKSSIHL